MMLSLASITVAAMDRVDVCKTTRLQDYSKTKRLQFTD